MSSQVIRDPHGKQMPLEEIANATALDIDMVVQALREEGLLD